MMRSWLFLQISKQEYARCNDRSGRHWKRRNGTLVNARDHHPGAATIAGMVAVPIPRDPGRPCGGWNSYQ